MNEQPSDDPLVYFFRRNGKKIEVCLSQMGKIIIGVLTAVFSAALIAGFSLLYSSAEGVAKLQVTVKAIDSKVDELDDKVDKQVGNVGERLDRYNTRLGSVEQALGGKADK